ncbi:MAG: hypothetical protein AAB368_08655, partial [bacterium]
MVGAMFVRRFSVVTILISTLVLVGGKAGADAWDPGDDAPGGATALTPDYPPQTHGPHTLGGTDTADWYAIPMTAGEKYTFTNLPRVELYSDAGGTNQVAAGGQNMTFTAPSSGTYYLKAMLETGSGTSWSGSLQYFHAAIVSYTNSVPLSPSRGTLFQIVFTVTNVGGIDVTDLYADLWVTWQDGGSAFQVSGPSPAPSPLSAGSSWSFTWTFSATGGGGIGFGTNAWGTRLGQNVHTPNGTQVDIMAPDAWDPGDDTPGGATAITPTLVFQQHGPHSMGGADQADWYAVSMTMGEVYLFGGPPRYELYSDIGGTNQVAMNDWGMMFTAPSSGVFYLKTSLNPWSGPTWNGDLRYFRAMLFAYEPPEQAAPVGSWITLSFTLSNIGGVDVNGITPQMWVEGMDAGKAEYRSGPTPPGPVNLLPGASQVFSWTYSVSGEGNVRFTFSAAGTEQSGGQMVFARNERDQQLGGPPNLNVSLSFVPGQVITGGSADVIVTVENAGGRVAGNVLPYLNVDWNPAGIAAMSG